MTPLPSDKWLRSTRLPEYALCLDPDHPLLWVEAVRAP